MNVLTVINERKLKLLQKTSMVENIPFSPAQNDLLSRQGVPIENFYRQLTDFSINPVTTTRTGVLIKNASGAPSSVQDQVICMFYVILILLSRRQPPSCGYCFIFVSISGVASSL